jgi:hypothetical protein
VDIGVVATPRYKDLQAFFQRHGLAEARWYDRRIAHWEKVVARENEG